MFHFNNIYLIGALTSKPYAFRSRSWELRSFNSYDFLDNYGTPIVVEVKGKDIFRVLPKGSNAINDGWISDKTRNSLDGFNLQRLGYPYRVETKTSSSFKLKKSSWHVIISYIAYEILFARLLNRFANWRVSFFGIVGPFVDTPSLILLKRFLNRLGSNDLVLLPELGAFNKDFRFNYLLNTQIDDLNKSDGCILLGTNPRLESPIFNLFLRKKQLSSKFSIFSFGTVLNPIYSLNIISNSILDFVLFIEGRHPLCSFFFKKKFPLLFVGSGLMKRGDSEFFFTLTQSLFKYINLYKDNWSGYNLINLYSNRVSAFDIGVGLQLKSNFLKETKPGYFLNDLSIFFFFGVERSKVFENYFEDSIQSLLFFFKEFRFKKRVDYRVRKPRQFDYKPKIYLLEYFNQVKKPISVFIGTHALTGVEHINYILPTKLPLESLSIFFNNYGSRFEIKPVLEGLRDSVSLRFILIILLAHTEMRLRLGFLNRATPFLKYNYLPFYLNKLDLQFNNGFLFNTLITSTVINNFYMIDSFSENSAVMSNSAKVILTQYNRNYLKI